MESNKSEIEFEKIAADNGTTDIDSQIAQDDEKILAGMGYKQELYRGLGAIMNFSFGFVEVAVLASISTGYAYGLSTGGPVVIIWSWVITWFFTMIVAYSMAEVCAVYPSAGSVYHWSGMISSNAMRPLNSYICGWTNFLGNAAGDAAFAYSWANFLAAAIVSPPTDGVTLTVQQTVAIAELVLFVWTVMNFINVAHIGWLSYFAAFFQVVSIILIFSTLMASPRLNSARWIFGNWQNQSGWSDMGYVVAIGLLNSLFGFAGYEASAHMAEETKGSRKAASDGIINTCWATGIGGMLYLFALVSATDLEKEDDYGYCCGITGTAIVDVFLISAGTSFGIFLTYLIVINLFFAGMASVTVTGRITFALLRDGAFPFSETWKKVDPNTQAPLRALVFVYFADALLLLLPLISTDGGGQAFSSIIGISAIGFDVSYGIPLLLKLIYKFNNFPQTSFSLGWKSNWMDIISVIWLFGTSCLLCLPSTYPVSKENMNYAIVVIAAFALVATIYWLVYARFYFHGPGSGANDLKTEEPVSSVTSETVRVKV